MTQFCSAVGIDCGQATLDAAIFPHKECLRVDNTPAGLQELAQWTARHGVTRVGLEASGGCERPVRNVLRDAGMEVYVLDPARVRHFAKAKGQRAKTDVLDAALIAEFTATLVDSAPLRSDPARESLADLIRVRRTLVEKRADLLKAVTHVPQIRADIDTVIAAMNQAVNVLEQKITQQIEEAALSSTVARLCTAPGIGPITAATLVALMPELGHTSGAKIAALLGVAPYADDSGRRRGSRHIRGGRAEVRKTIYMAALGPATRGHGALAALYRRLIERGKPAKLALTACMRKFIVRLNAMLANDADWEDNTHTATAG